MTWFRSTVATATEVGVGVGFSDGEGMGVIPAPGTTVGVGFNDGDGIGVTSVSGTFEGVGLTPVPGDGVGLGGASVGVIGGGDGMVVGFGVDGSLAPPHAESNATISIAPANPFAICFAPII